MSKNKSYIIRCTDGSEIEYSYKEIFDLVKDYLSKDGKFPTTAEVDEEIPLFLSRYKKVVK